MPFQLLAAIAEGCHVSGAAAECFSAAVALVDESWPAFTGPQNWGRSF